MCIQQHKRGKIHMGGDMGQVWPISPSFAMLVTTCSSGHKGGWEVFQKCTPKRRMSVHGPFTLSATASNSFRFIVFSDSFLSLVYFIFGCAVSSLLHTDFSLVMASRGHSPVVIHRDLTAVTSLVVEHGLQ